MAVASRLRLNAFPWTITTGRRKLGPEPEGSGRSAHQTSRRRSRRGVSETVNDLIRRGLETPVDRPAFVQRTQALGLRIDVGNVADALELIEGSTRR